MALQHVEGTIYTISYRDDNYSNRTITMIGGYAPETIWALAECLLPCVRDIWFSGNPTVVVAAIEAMGDISEVANPTP